MNYKVSKQHIRSGDLIAFRGLGPLSRFICRVTGNAYSHVGIAIVYQDRVFVIQDKEGHGIIIVPLSTMLPCDWIGTGALWTDEVEKFAFAHIGQGYSYLNAFLAGIGLPPRGVKSICSQYAASILRQAGVLDNSVRILTPGDLVNRLLDLGHPLEKIID